MAHAPGQVPTAILLGLMVPRIVTIEDIVRDLGLNERQARRGVECLLRRGLMRHYRRALGQVRLTWQGAEAARMGTTIRPGPSGPTGPKSRRDEGFRDRVWRSVRIRRGFTAAEVAMDAARDEKGPEKAAYRYLELLVGAGILVIVRGATRREAALRLPVRRTYRLIRDPGPLTPVWDAAAGALRDPNAVRKGGGRARS